MSGQKDYKKDYARIVDEHFPDELRISLGEQTLLYKKRNWSIPEKGEIVKRGLRYGENPGQEAAIYELVQGNLVIGECSYITPGNGLVSSVSEKDLIQIGKHPSMNNLTDVDSALNILKFFPEKPTVVIVKHSNPSGVAQRETLKEAYIEANLADRLAAFGGAAVFNRKLDRETAEEIIKNYLEVVCAPEFDEKALEIMKTKKNLRIILIRNIKNLERYQNMRFLDFKSMTDGGIVVQQSPILTITSKNDLEPATATKEERDYKIERAPTEQEYEDMIFGWKVEYGVKSNSVIYVKNKATVAIGTGGQDRVGVAEMAAAKAYTKYADRICAEKQGMPYWVFSMKVKKGEIAESEKKKIDDEVERQKGNLKGSVMVSDGFFPFRDTVDVAAKYGVTAIIQPGGSIRDFESIEACNEHGISMVFTGQRAFKH
ncbi:IMP cyclohydrolase [Candidatus Woesearchaeota archaeon]|nr:IMP cyclohydrolase [Candidatus Woesearchaeota archaeon]